MTTVGTVDPSRGGGTETAACLNCGAALTGPFCARCGQKHPHPDPSLREFLRESTQELTHWDGKLPTTLKALFLQPGLLTREFLAGRRARWLTPLRLYAICSLAYFVSGPVVEAITGRTAREVAKITVTNNDGSTTLTPEGRKSIEESLPGRLFGTARFERAAANSTQLNSVINSAYPKAMFVLLPLFAALTRIAWRRKVPHYPAHLYLALHLHAAWFGALTITTLATVFPIPTQAAIALQVAAFPYVVWYGLAALRRVFGDSRIRTIVKAAAVGVVYAVCLFAVSLGMLGYAVMKM